MSSRLASSRARVTAWEPEEHSMVQDDSPGWPVDCCCLLIPSQDSQAELMEASDYWNHMISMYMQSEQERHWFGVNRKNCPNFSFQCLSACHATLICVDPIRVQAQAPIGGVVASLEEMYAVWVQSPFSSRSSRWSVEASEALYQVRMVVWSLTCHTSYLELIHLQLYTI